MAVDYLSAPPLTAPQEPPPLRRFVTTRPPACKCWFTGLQHKDFGSLLTQEGQCSTKTQALVKADNNQSKFPDGRLAVWGLAESISNMVVPNRSALAAVLLAVVCFQARAESHVQELTDGNFDDTISSSKNTWLIKFTAPVSCGSGWVLLRRVKHKTFRSGVDTANYLNLNLHVLPVKWSL